MIHDGAQPSIATTPWESTTLAWTMPLVSSPWTADWLAFKYNSSNTTPPTPPNRTPQWHPRRQVEHFPHSPSTVSRLLCRCPGQLGRAGRRRWVTRTGAPAWRTGLCSECAHKLAGCCAHGQRTHLGWRRAQTMGCLPPMNWHRISQSSTGIYKLGRFSMATFDCPRVMSGLMMLYHVWRAYLQS